MSISSSHPRWARLGVCLLAGALFGLAALGGCGEGEDLDTAILLRVTLDGDSGALDGDLHELRFLIAYTNSERPSYVLDREANGTEASVAGRSLVDSPYEMLIKPDEAGRADGVKVIVEAYVDGELKAWGTLRNPDHADFLAGKIISRTVELHSTATNAYPFVVSPTGCVLIGDHGEVMLASPDDMDCDNVPKGEDCNDKDPTISPEQQEVCRNGIDDNCNGITDEDAEVDNDGDDLTICDGDCDDTDPAVYPGAPERCDGKDNDCNELCDELYDHDGDGFTSCLYDELSPSETGTKIIDGRCEPGEVSPDLFDCNDNAPDAHPGGVEVCDGLDNDCDGTCDVEYDADGDGWSTCGSMPGDPNNEVPPGTHCEPPDTFHADCNDSDPTINPGEIDTVCDGVDHSCGHANELDGFHQPCYVDMGSQGNEQCMAGERVCHDDGGMGWSECMQLNAELEPPQACMVYEQCLADNPQDPIGCFTESFHYQVQEDCQVVYFDTMQTQDYLCHTKPHHYLPNPDYVNTCWWYLWNPLPTTPWEVRLSGGYPEGPYENPVPCSEISMLVAWVPNYTDLTNTPSEDVSLVLEVDGIHIVLPLTLSLLPANETDCTAAGSGTGMTCGPMSITP
jgi:hypothetical protein